MVGYCFNLPQGAEIFGQWLYHWQTLIAGTSAIGAAYFGARAVYKQSQQSLALANDEIKRRHAAARVTLPLALSEISGLIQEMADRVAAVLETLYGADSETAPGAIGDGQVAPARFEQVKIPSEVRLAFERFVETLEKESDKKHVAELFGSLQISIDRYNSQNIKSILLKDELIWRILDFAKCRYLADEIFNYARFVDNRSFGKVDEIEHSEAWDEIRSRAVGLVFFRKNLDAFSRDFADKISRLKNNNDSPWLEKFVRW